MTLADVKKKTLALIESISPTNPLLTEDDDIQAKINYVINQIQFEASRMKKISAYVEVAVEEGDFTTAKELVADLYQLKTIKGVAYDIEENYITFNETGTAKIYYYKYPVAITKDTLDSYIMELDEDVLEVIPYGIASDLLKSDPSEQYGGIYASRYAELMSKLDPRGSMILVKIEGGI